MFLFVPVYTSELKVLHLRECTFQTKSELLQQKVRLWKFHFLISYKANNGYWFISSGGGGREDPPPETEKIFKLYISVKNLPIFNK